MPDRDPGRAVFTLILIAVTIVVAVMLHSYLFSPSSSTTGTLTGNVAIGPLCPVEPCSVTPDRLAAAFAARTIVVSDTRGAIIANTVPDHETGYSFVLKPGTYNIDIRRQGVDRSPDLPKTVTIHEGETVRLDISIDTGIR